MPTKKGAGGKPQEYDEHTGRFGGGGIDNGESGSEGELAEHEFLQEQLTRKAEGRTPLKRDIYASLSKVEWAKYYKALGEMKAGTLRTRYFGNGARIVVVDNKIILDNGKYITPKVKAVLEFETEDKLVDYFNKMEREGVIW